MKYLVLRAKVFSPGKGNRIKLEKVYSESPIRDTVVENLYNVLTLVFDKEKKQHISRPFESLDDHKKLQKFKDKVVYTETDTVELGSDLFDWIKANFKVDGFGSASSATVVALSEMLDECDKQDEDKAEKEFKKHKDDKPMTVAEFFTSIGAVVEIEVKKEEVAA